MANNDGQILVDGVSAANSNNIQDTITLNATAGTLGSIIFQNNPSTFRALTVESDNGITVSNNSSITTSVGNLAMDGDIDGGVGSNDSITLNSDLTSTENLTLSATNGGIILNSPITLTANGITFNNAVSGGYNLTLNAGSSGDITFLGSTGLNLTSNANITGNTVDGAVNVAGLTLHVNFANLNGFVDGLSGEAAIAKIVNLNAISAGTHFFDGIDMYSNPTPPTSPDAQFSLLSAIPQITFPDLYPLSEVQPNLNNNLGLQKVNYMDVLTKLDNGRKGCDSLGSNISICASSQ